MPTIAQPGTHYLPTLENKLVRVYPFKKEVVKKIFKDLMKRPNFMLPKLRMLKEVSRTYDPNYFSYHHRLAHPINKFFIFKN